ncbi:MAG TPA: N-methyl-L-tryptophan oxidase [Planctomycetaceae bacterium]|nr:N-methyl-L-tryptophan oxidase [Planctomycetaceae bacterium]
MPSTTYDAIVLGAGGIGSAALWQLASRGARVLALDRFAPPHGRGSTHGATRIIRQAYFEHPDYVPLLVRAYHLWRALEGETGQPLMHLCGLMLAGPADGEAIPGAKLSAGRHGLAIDELAADECRRRFPGFRIPDAFHAVYEPNAGYLDVENCVRAHIERAVAHGAALQTGETVVDWTSDGRRVTVRTDRGQYEAERLVIAAGAWAGRLIPDLPVALRVVRKPQFWHEVASCDYDLSAGAPAYFFELPGGAFYGFPCLDGRFVKVAEHTGGLEVADPLTIDREVHDADVRPVMEFVRQSLPGVRPEPSRHSVCMYTFSPDGHFLVDHHPVHQNVVIAAGFSGHGFKFTGVLGEALADLALDGCTRHPIEFLSLGRFSLNDSLQSDDRLESDPRFLKRIEAARRSLERGRGVRLEELHD